MKILITFFCEKCLIHCSKDTHGREYVSIIMSYLIYLVNRMKLATSITNRDAYLTWNLRQTSLFERNYLSPVFDTRHCMFNETPLINIII